MDIYVSIWSLRHTLRARGLGLTDAPALVRTHGFAGIEVADRGLGEPGPAADTLAAACRSADCALVFDINCDLTLADPQQQAREEAHVRNMLALAADLGATTARISLGGQAFSIQKLTARRGPAPAGANTRGTRGRLTKLLFNRTLLKLAPVVRRNLPSRIPGAQTKLSRAIQALERLVPAAAARNIRLGIENHWGVSGRPEYIMTVVDALDSPWLGTCPDFGNFPHDVDRYAGLAALAPRAVHLQAKSTRFTAAGEEQDIDYRRCLEIFNRAGYRGPIAIEYEGGGDDLAGCLRTRDLIRRYATAGLSESTAGSA